MEVGPSLWELWASSSLVCPSVVVTLPTMSLWMHSLIPRASARWTGVRLVLPGHHGAGMRTAAWKPAIWSRWNHLGDSAPARRGPGAHMAASAAGGQSPFSLPAAPLHLFFPPNSAPPLMGGASGLGKVTSPAPPLLEADHEALSPGCVSVCWGRPAKHR